MINECLGSSPVGFAGGADLADGVAAPAQDRRNGPDEGEGPDEQQTQSCVFASQTDVPQRPTDDEEPLERQDGQRPQSHDTCRFRHIDNISPKHLRRLNHVLQTLQSQKPQEIYLLHEL